ncbi:sodium/potassium/calcium exchanger 2 isoform X1 [Gallus gallus]|uniref:Solute carrier family 24 member 2 n=1 Tax=Gallus gallus TaxID=9031 RepID=A0A1L1RQA3_CHICK|nr:sodium/potassium/calcium exchanger 2 isoform 2 [Gallus gallus]NP_001384041.1 sodium/potassium/calcium exchanger 2 isoform 2 [Gallus gallus]XP_015135570.1 sodium/potassium/calcium exchanger 2 isoform X1 [Gallus gallus]XP_040511411.1 sodium/potassium/calcium exchanger 2 isoform X1 [Gallus gallus]XP_046761242.1 sodium/potassium/calcium exchanger 2 isoform X1 [Gallus gallus]XP_046790885.1 sodium/potassium/calcium exchanger 2 isoform X1 [Gallus gallus]XP_046790886.1 sodium/potassium/calcium exc|eukprot:XP_015135569.1 sodium/potassium/calcium exchanger 2 isoform X1 [Gallus gallus]
MALCKKTVGSVLEEWCLNEPLFGCKRHQNVRKKLRLIRIIGLLVSVVAISTFSLSISAFFKMETHSKVLASSLESQKLVHGHQRTLLDFMEQNEGSTPDSPTSMKHEAEHDNATEEHSKGEYPEDLFSLEERRKGAVILHVIGMIYMFIALAIVCDEFFVPSLTVITEKLSISDDVAGATFMAAGGSAPELFTSLIGVFISHSNVGIGTIVGSAVFNILFVIGMCALFSREILNLTWWPLFRDVSFYIVDLILLIIFFLDNLIMWWESLTLLTAYFCYVTFMKFNVQVEEWVKKVLNRNKVEKATTGDAEGKSPTAGDKDDQTLTTKPRLQRGGSSASLHNSLMRNSIFQLMIHTLDPLAEELGSYGNLKYYDTMTEEGKFKERASILHKIAKKKCQVEDSERQNGAANHEKGAKVEVAVTPPSDSGPVQNGIAHNVDEENEEDEDQPLSLAWPDTPRKQLTYLLVLPIVFPLWVSLPDVRNPRSRKFFPITFFGSISWIAFFSYLMVWWAHQVGETIGISEEIMGLTILAAGTSIPDLITSVIVARKGLGDMAVSSSVGSNIFDITVGLPLPWLLYAVINNFSPVTVSSNGLFCAIVLLFIMLLFVILSIAFCKWRMNKFLGFLMFGLYFVFLIVSVLLEDKVIQCPVSI